MLLEVHAFATLFMVGLVWTIQVVHYPLLALVGPDAFPAYHERHCVRIGYLVGPGMGVELVTAMLLVFAPSGAPPWMVWTGLALVGVVWLMTALVHFPQHRRLGDAGYDRDLVARLVVSNRVRTAAWTARGVLALAMLRTA